MDLFQSGKVTNVTIIIGGKIVPKEDCLSFAGQENNC